MSSCPARANAFLTHYIGGPFDMDGDGPGGWWILPEPGIELPRSPEVAPDALPDYLRQLDAATDLLDYSVISF